MRSLSLCHFGDCRFYTYRARKKESFPSVVEGVGQDKNIVSDFLVLHFAITIPKQSTDTFLSQSCGPSELRERRLSYSQVASRC